MQVGSKNDAPLGASVISIHDLTSRHLEFRISVQELPVRIVYR